jgi:Undecaprenyl-phosphate galactose phosphotransferase WbaP
MNQLIDKSIPPFKGRQFVIVSLLVLVDIISLGLGFRLSVEIRRWMIPIFGGSIPPDAFSAIMAQGLVIFTIIYALNGLYPGFGSTAVEETRQIFYSLTLGYGVLALVIYFQQAGQDMSRTIFVLAWGLGCILNIVFRFALRNRFSLLHWWGTPVLVVGPVERTHDVIHKLNNCRRLGLRPVLIFDEACPPEITQVLRVPVTNSLLTVESFIGSRRIDYAVFVGQDIQDQILRWLGERFASVLLVLDISPLGSLWVKTMDLEGRLTLKTQYHLLNRNATVMKRIFDLLGGWISGLILSPIMLIIALLIRIDSPGPILYSHERMGRGGKKFPCYKFRTMQVGAEEQLNDLLQSDSSALQEYQLYHKLSNDPRITRVGRILRKFSLDELPQIWNIITGDLSLVGPRAYLPRECNDMGSYASLILRISPGLTGWWQVMGRHSTTFNERLRLDEYYLSNWSLWMDFFIIIKTVWILLSGKGA